MVTKPQIHIANGDIGGSGGGGGTGDVTGPSVAVNNDIAVFNGTTGKLLKDGGNTINDVVNTAVNGAIASIIPIDLTSEVSGVLPIAHMATGTPTGSKFVRDDGTLAVPPTGTGNITSTGAQGSEPGSPASGDLYLPNNGLSVERYSGSAWVPWGPLWPMTAPVSGDFAWVNQGAAAVSTTNGGVILSMAAEAGVQIRARVKTTPSTPYTITAFIMPTILNAGGVGLCWRDSASGKLTLAQIAIASVGLYDFTNETTFSATVLSPITLMFPGGIWLRIADNGTNKSLSWSGDGYTWVVLNSRTRTTFLTPNQVGFYLNNTNSDYAIAQALLSWKEA